ncbi:MAG: septal ring lytic transglycosylase RlpA family protein [Rhodocyclaceae bacterium]|nr:septal ring lytic transglycosylase RlpA family protein [Rhodocyclaceae bacterium]
MLFALGLLAGCGSTPIPSGPERVPDERPGGYYQDDGPHANPPADLAAVPDAVPREEPLHRFANRPYEALGQSFTPQTQVAPFTQRGKASWYGRKFHGKRTASGEVYDMYKMTAAHPTLPIPSYARVTNLGNGRSVVVRVNDRGPFLRGRVIDLSYAAAYRLGYIEQGSAAVEVMSIVPGDEVEMASGRAVPPLRRPGVAVVESAAVALPSLPEASAIEALPLPAAPLDTAAGVAASVAGEGGEASAGKPGEAPLVDTAPAPTPAVAAGGDAPIAPAAASPTAEQHFVQLGAFSSRANAEDFRTMAAGELGEPVERLQVVPIGLRFRLHLGPYATVEEARKRAETVGATLKIKAFAVSR